MFKSLWCRLFHRKQHYSAEGYQGVFVWKCCDKCGRTWKFRFGR